MGSIDSVRCENVRERGTESSASYGSAGQSRVQQLGSHSDGRDNGIEDGRMFSRPREAI